jgi:ribosomal protein L37E
MRNSTIIVKKKRCVNCGNIDYHFSKKMCKQCATIHSTQKRMEEFEDDSESFQNLVQDLDAVFSQYIRCKYADKEGMVECFTSGKKYHWTKIHNGHFIPRTNLATRWLEHNCRPQSEHDNCFLSGNLEVYSKKLEQESPGIVEFLQTIARQVEKPTKDELKSLIIEYRSKLNQVKKKFLQG